ncbi:MAG: HEPN domain-containing protein [Holophagaceae bacterium]|nr:HEPN domain-containing protein [Holophagaceae bacterium]
MKELSDRWIAKAEAHLETAKRELAVKKGANPDAVCLHTHLCAENYLKARLQEGDIDFPTTSHLAVLLYLCADIEPSWESHRTHLSKLSAINRLIQEPEESATQDMAKEALELASTFRETARKTLGLKA